MIRTSIRKRPLCGVCISLMVLILLAKLTGLPLFGEPPDSPALQACTEQEETVQIIGTVKTRSVKSKSVQYVLIHSSLRSEEQTIPLHTISCTAKNQKELKAGSLVLVSGILSRPERASNPGQFDLADYYASQRIYYTLYADSFQIVEEGSGIREVLLQIREKLSALLSEYAEPETAEALQAIMLGDRSGLSSDLKRSFQVGGILHILAISGLHISLLGQGLLKLLQKLRLPFPIAALLSFLFLVFYAGITGAASSSVRAVIMFSVYLGAKLLLRTYDALSALSFAGILLLLENPAVLFASGFQLSFSAILAVSFVWPAVSWLLPGQVKKPDSRKETAGLDERERGKLKIKNISEQLYYLWRLLLHQSCFWLVITGSMLPLTAWYYFEIPVWGLLPNLVLIPTAPILLLSGAAGAAAGWFSSAAGRLALLPAEGILKGIRFLTELIQRLPFATYVCGQPALWQVLAAEVLLLGLTAYLLMGRREEKRRREIESAGAGKRKSAGYGKTALVGTILMLGILLLRHNPEWSLTMVDVGQGDSLVLRDRKACFLIDGGSSSVSQVGTYRILPYLKSQGISHLDGILVSHPDEDHTNGILELLEIVKERGATLTVDFLYLPLWMKESEEERELKEAAEQCGAEVRYLARGDRIESSTIELTVLSPFYEGGIRSGNSGSVVLSLTCGEFDALLTGDLERDGEQLLLPLDENYDYLKVGHHGSKGSSSQEFLDQVQPSVAAVSAPANSSYGHPHQETLERLEKAGADIYVTRDLGAITVEGSRNRWKLWGYLG